MTRSLLHHRIQRHLLILLCLAGVALTIPASAMAAGATKVVGYHGHRVTVPAGWPVYHVSKSSTVCVRFNRNAVYLGRPGTTQHCPASAIGRRDAILVEPLSGTTPPNLRGSARIVDHKHGVVVTATWGDDRAAIRRALGVRSLSRLAAASYVTPQPAPAALQPASSSTAHSLSPLATLSSRLSGPASPGATFSGEGFDACTAPNKSDMAAWAKALKNPYAAVGIYLPMAPLAACAQPNLTADWVTTESAAGWHLIPIYVGLQAPHNSCACAYIKGGQAISDGAAAADDAVAQAQALGIGTGNPIYYDMEAYTHDSVDTTRVLNFLQAWTGTLRAHGYLSGVYSSTASGITDLVSKYGTSYLEPDDIWFANWNDSTTLTDPVLPTGDWVSGHRLHQYKGGHNETHDHVKLNIDSNSLSAQTAAAGQGPAVATTPPAETQGPMLTGRPLVGQHLVEHHANWTGWPYLFSYVWQRCDGHGNNCQTISHDASPRYRLRARDAGHRFRIVETAGNILGKTTATSHASFRIHKNPSGFWLFSAQGNIFTSRYEAFYGSPSSRHRGISNIVGMAATTDGRGYWLAASDGTVYSYGDAPSYPYKVHKGTSHPIIGIVASPTGGYWLYTANGHIHASGGAGFYGSMNSKRVHVHSVVGLAPTPDGGGYWLVTRWGAVYAFGDAPHYRRMKHSHPIIGVTSSPEWGYWLYTAYGDVSSTPGTPLYGSLAGKNIQNNDITSLSTTPNGHGYWLASSTGAVYHFGNARGSAHPHPKVPLLGLVGQ